ncbi:hypothetical protein [Adhaeribacter pallidiroseus]|nr:hypothetical protein [Adhaeribacter pallidiroseus]
MRQYLDNFNSFYKQPFAVPRKARNRIRGILMGFPGKSYQVLEVHSGHITRSFF